MHLSRSIYHRLRTQHESIADLVNEMDHPRIMRHPSPGKWNIHDNIAHLARYQPVFRERVERILEQDEPVFPRYVAEEDPFFETWRAMDTAELMSRLADDRESLCSFISDLDPKELERCGVHMNFGRLHLVGWTEFFLLHEAHHMFTIFQLAYPKEG